MVNLHGIYKISNCCFLAKCNIQQAISAKMMILDIGINLMSDEHLIVLLLDMVPQQCQESDAPIGYNLKECSNSVYDFLIFSYFIRRFGHMYGISRKRFPWASHTGSSIVNENKTDIP